MAEQSIEELKAILSLHEEDSAAKLFYSLKRKMSEMADLMNKHNLSTLIIDDPKDKTFERLKAVWGDAATIATAVDALGKFAKITGDEQADVARKPFVDTIADKRN